jgi:hypothetical protein
MEQESIFTSISVLETHFPKAYLIAYSTASFHVFDLLHIRRITILLLYLRQASCVLQHFTCGCVDSFKNIYVSYTIHSSPSTMMK